MIAGLICRQELFSIKCMVFMTQNSRLILTVNVDSNIMTRLTQV